MSGQSEVFRFITHFAGNIVTNLILIEP